MTDEKPILWAESQTIPHLHEAFIDGRLVAWIEKRPHYCDRGHWSANVEGLQFAQLNNPIDSADRFPRYYMHLDIAKQEMTEWLRWRLWRVRAE